MKTLGLLFAGALLMFFGMIWGGFVVSHMWGWFAVPIFHLRALSVTEAIGVCCLIDIFKSHNYSKDGGIDWAKGFNLVFAMPAISFLVGYIVHRCM